MEKKKLLLVSVSVGAFLIIVIAASYLVIQPKSGVVSPEAVSEGNLGYEDAAAGNTVIDAIPPAGIEGGGLPSLPGVPGYTDPLVPVQPALVDPTGMVRNPDGIRGLQQPPLKSITDGIEQDGALISIVPPSRAGVSDAPPAGKAASRQALEAGPRDVPRQAPAEKAPAAATQSAPIPVAMAEPKPRDYFWVQVGSFTHQSKAEDLRKHLDSKGMKSVIDPTELNSVTYFRVRIGPYVSKDEAASFWLPFVKAMGYEDSQVWQTTIR
ncbi:MAG: SPOR domain-containing protein [Treponema sp.]|jgi:cell division septation protein DedD|nr:SPOR domain-containing protein [Treponema sp.]